MMLDRLAERLRAMLTAEPEGSEQDDVRSDPELDANHTRTARTGWLLVAFGFGGFLLWAGLAPLDQGVPVQGKVVVTGNRKVVQNLSAGMVQEILVKDGDEVRVGDVLVRLNPTMARSQYEVALSQWFVARAGEARLLAEIEGRSEVLYPEDLLRMKDDPRARDAMTVQSQLLRTRTEGLKAELNAMRSSLAGLQSSVQALEASRRAKEEQAKLLSEELAGLRPLAADGYFPRNQLLERERLLAQLNGAISEDLGNLGRTRQAINEVQMKMVAREQEQHKEAENALADLQREATSLASRMKGLEFELQHTEVRSPAEGVIVGLNVHTIGGVLVAGTPLMEVVPRTEPLRLDVQIPTTLIDKVRPGLPAEITFPAFNQRITPQIPGRFEQVAADATTDPEQRFPPYYSGQVVVTEEGMAKLEANEIKPGMPAEVFIRTGERTLLNYLFRPMRDRLRSALTEE